MGDVAQLYDALRAFDSEGQFGEEDYLALRRVVAGVGRVDALLLDGLVGLFFERHLLDDTRRAELLAMNHSELERAVRHRFKQVVAGDQDSHQAWHALSAHVREALETLVGPGHAGYPSSIATPQGFSAIAVEQAVAAVWSELRRKPSSREATQELFGRYVSNGVAPEPGVSTAREIPQSVVRRLDAHRLARSIAAVLDDDERDLLRAQLEGQAVDAWAQGRGVSRATAYRLLARVKALCQLEIIERSYSTRLEVLDVLRQQLELKE